MTSLASNLPDRTNDCPLGARWCGWTLYAIVNGRHMPADERAAIQRARRRASTWTAIRRQPVNWSVGDGDASRLPGYADTLSHPRHRHCWLEVGRRAVHIDWVTREGGSPGFSYSMVRVYVDRTLRDEQVHGGSALGFTAWGTTAVAPVRRGLAVGLAPGRFLDPQPPLVWWMTTAGRDGQAREEGGR